MFSLSACDVCVFRWVTSSEMQRLEVTESVNQKGKLKGSRSWRAAGGGMLSLCACVRVCFRWMASSQTERLKANESVSQKDMLNGSGSWRAAGGGLLRLLVHG